jgi:hypothetical protein
MRAMKTTSQPEPDPYTADDRGNVVNFYYAESGDEAGMIDREYEIKDHVCVAAYFEGSDDLKQWAEANGYAEEIKFCMETGNRTPEQTPECKGGACPL